MRFGQNFGLRQIKPITVRLLSLLALLGAGHAGARYCAPPIAPDPLDLGSVTRVEQSETRDSGSTFKQQRTYQGGRLMGTSTEMGSRLMGTSTWSETWHHTPAGQPARIDTVDGPLPGRAPSTQEGREYDDQGRLVQVLYKAGARKTWATLATCSYTPGRVTQHETDVQGFKPKTTVFTLDAGGRVTHVTRTMQGHEKDTDVTTVVRDAIGGAVTRTETRVMSNTTPLDVTVTTYNSAGLPLQAVNTSHDKGGAIQYTHTTTFEYVLDARGNWTQKTEYTSMGGPRKLDSTETRIITYARP